MGRATAWAGKLLEWYRTGRRDLPWRRSGDPYRIWISEVMLQQTRVEAVIPYYQRFVAEFPRLEDLARAPLDRVLALWSGLGYYDRARSLHLAVRECAERHAGRVPADPEAFGALRGVGPYTRAAVLSIAYGLPLAVVDGNVVRVLARYFALPGHARDPELIERVRRRASAALPPEAAGDFNQAVMELGALVCLPRTPRCPLCPLRAGCAGRRSGEPGRFPAPAPRRAPRELRWSAALVERKGAVLLVRRGEEGRFKGMWELPWAEGGFAAIGERLGLGLKRGAKVARLRHSVLHERITVEVHAAQLTRQAAGARLSWVERDRMGEHALSSVWRKVLEGTRGVVERE